MKTCICLLVLLTSFFASHAQEDYLKYHRNIIRCEEHFLSHSSDSIPQALITYKAVFNQYKKPFAKDCFIALQLACSIKDTGSASFLFQKAFERGVEWTAIMEAKTIASLLAANPAYGLQIRAIYNEIHPQYLKTINASLRTKVIEMKNRDDSFKMRIQGLPSGPERDQKKADFLAVLDSNTLQIVALTKQYGFLGDNIVGLMNYGFQNDEEQRRKHCYQLRSLIDQLYFHHGCCYLLLQREMAFALSSGDISPAMYAVIYEWSHKSLKERGPEMSLCNGAGNVQEKYYNICPVIPPWDKNPDIKLVDKCREEIGLASQEHFQRKKTFQEVTGMRMFFGMFDTY